MPDNTPQDNLAEEQQTAEELQDQESVTEEIVAEDLAEQESAEQEPAEQEVVDQESAEQESAKQETAEQEATEQDPAAEEPAAHEETDPEPTAEEPAVQQPAESSDPTESTPEASVPEASKPEPPKKKPRLESIDGYVDELSRELDMEFADDEEASIEEPEEDPSAEAAEDRVEEHRKESSASDFDADSVLDSELDEVALKNEEPALLLKEDKIEKQQLEEERIAATFKKAPRNTHVITQADKKPAQEEAHSEQRTTREEAQSSLETLAPPIKEKRSRKKKAREAKPQACATKPRAAHIQEPQARPNKPQARPQEEPQARTNKQPKTPVKRITHTYLKSPSLKQAFRNFGKLKGGVAWREVYAPVIVFMLLFALLSLAVVDSLPIVDSFNQTFNTLIQQTRGSLDGIVITLTTIGDFLPMAGVCLLVCVILYIGGKWDSLAYFITNALLAIICIQALKLIFAVPRPGDETLVPLPLSFSFPSAHSFCSLVIFGLIGLLIFRALYARGVARNVAMAPGIVLVVFAIFIGLSRIYVGVHWPSDVLGGWLLAGAWLAFAGALYTAGARQK